MHALYLGGVYISNSEYNSIPAALSALIVGLQPLLTSTIANRLLGERVVIRHGVAYSFLLAAYIS